MNHFIVIVNFSDDQTRRMSAFERTVEELFPKSYQERDEGVFLVSSEMKASEVVSALDVGWFNFFLVVEIGKSAAQGLTSTTFYAELLKRLSGEEELDES